MAGLSELHSFNGVQSFRSQEVRRILMERPAMVGFPAVQSSVISGSSGGLSNVDFAGAVPTDGRAEGEGEGRGEGSW